MRKYRIISFFAVMLIFFFSCDLSVEPPQPNFYASEYSSTNTEIVISFSDQSSNSPDEWFWTFEGGYPSTSTYSNPTVSYTSSGTFDVTLAVSNEGGEKTVIYEDYINVGAFNNTNWTEMEITVDYDTKTIPVDGYVLYASIDNTSMSYYAETYGATTGGTQIGLLLYWDKTIDLNDASDRYPYINKDYVFINVTNYGYDEFYPFYVNYGTTDQSVDYIIIDNDGIKKSTGYYDAFDYMEVRAYFQDDQYSWVYWIEGTHFNMPWADNQGLNLWYSPKESIKAYAEVETKNIKYSGAGKDPQSGVK
ncbi:PKD domain-containing protein [Bacteroidota bacterium]